MKKLLPIAAALLIASPAYAQVDLGTSASATNPQRTGEATTGLFSPAASSVAIAGGGVQQMLINGTGVGIGTSSPAYLLDVNLNIANNMRLLSDPGSVNGFIESPYGNLLFSSNAYYNSNFYYEQAGYASVFQIEGNSGDFVFDTAPSGTAGSVVNFVPVVHITNSGSVGIGTTAPAAMLDVGIPGTKLGTARLEGSTSGYVQIQPAAAAGSWTMTLPTSAGTSGYVLATDGTGITSWTAAGAAGSFQEAAGRLQCSGTNCGNSTGSSTIAFCPYKGNIKTTAAQGNYTIPSTCPSATLTSMYVGGVAGSSVAASTLYYIYLWNVSGTWVLDADTTGHSTDSSSGIETKNGDNTKTLIGMIYSDPNKHVMSRGQTSLPGDTNSVATWDNRVPTYTQCSFTVDRTLTATAYTEINSENRCRFMSWGDAAIFTSSQNFYSNVSGLGGGVVTEASLDIVTSNVFGYTSITPGAATYYALAFPAGEQIPASEGYHFTILDGAVGTTGTTITYRGNHESTVYSVQ